MKFFLQLSLLTFLLLAIACNKNEMTISFENEQDSLHLIVPLYSFPTDDDGAIWNAVLTASQSVPIAVIWGLVDTADQAIYQQYISRLRSGKYISLYAYVATSSGQRNIDEVKQEIDYYVNHFDIDGIFFDEVSHQTEDIPYYQNIVSYAKHFSEVNSVILNSSYAPADFLEQTGADILIIFENYGRDWDDFTPEDYKTLSTQQKAIIVHSVFFASRMQGIITDAVQNNIGYVYVTDKEYDKLPSYWDKEVDFVEQVNSH